MRKCNDCVRDGTLISCCAGGDDEGAQKYPGSAIPKQVQISLRKPFQGKSSVC